MAAEATAEAAAEAPRSTLPQRVVQLVTRIAKQYVENAKKELQGDITRIAIGISFLFVMGVFSIHAVIFAHVLVVVGLTALGLPQWGVVGAVFFGDVFVVLFSAVMARFLLFRPLLPRTRKQIGEAWTFLVGE